MNTLIAAQLSKPAAMNATTQEIQLSAGLLTMSEARDMSA